MTGKRFSVAAEYVLRVLGLDYISDTFVGPSKTLNPENRYTLIPYFAIHIEFENDTCATGYFLQAIPPTQSHPVRRGYACQSRFTLLSPGF